MDEQAGLFGKVQRIVLELKIRYQSLEKTEQKGLVQTADYAARCGADEAHLLIFDRRPETTWDEKIWHKPAHQDTGEIAVWGL